MYVGRQVWIFKEGPFPGSEESDNKEVKNVNSQKYPSNRSQDTPKKLHFSSSNLVLIVERLN